MTDVPLFTADSDALATTSQWCEDAGITLRILPQMPVTPSAPLLQQEADGLSLIVPGFAKPFRLTARTIQRRARGRQLLMQACGRQGTLLDAFAGFGRDGFQLATRHRVTMLERHPVVYLLLKDFAVRLNAAVECVFADANAYLKALMEPPQTIYLDPMFSQRNKRALPNRSLQHLRALTHGQVVDVEALLELALSRATSRVVLKRRPKDPVVLKPAFQVRGKSVRYDVYA